MSKLKEILDWKREEVAARKRQGLPDATDSGPRDFAAALLNAKTAPALIAEVKKASPSAGLIRPDFDPVAIARSYERCGAACLSVLTDERYFQGSDENLVKCRAATSLPALRKDFVVDAFQVEEARRLGADAILLIVAALNLGELVDLREQAESLGMPALVEVHDKAEMETALESGAKVIGVNNRNLATFEVDVAVTERLLPLAGNSRILISESGLHHRQDVERVHRAGAQAVLIGTAFCESPDLESKVLELMKP